MSTATTIRKFLDARHVRCEEMHHPHTATSWATAVSANVEPDCVAKAVVVGDERGLMLAVVPASHQVKIKQLRRATGRNLHFVPEHVFAEMFHDCEIGAIPALGQAYGMETVWDDCLADQTDIYFEAGDHESLMHVSGRDFIDMMRSSRHDCISHRM